MNQMLQIVTVVYLLPIGLCACAADSPKMSTAALSGEETQTMIQNEPMTVVGIELRTTNEKAFEEIPLHWRKFYQESVLDKVPNRASGDVYAVYTNFENPGKNNSGVYSLIIGAPVKSLDHIPPSLVATVIPKSKRRVRSVATGHPEKVGEKWQEIWHLADLKKTYVSDFERYQPSGNIEIFVGVE
jgi:predicted transcriptional regulator YdeE